MSVHDEDRFGVAVTVYCDDCLEAVDADYMVPAGVDSLATARHHLSTNLGWHIATGMDLCPACKPEQPARDTETAAPVPG